LLKILCIVEVQQEPRPDQSFKKFLQERRHPREGLEGQLSNKRWRRIS